MANEYVSKVVLSNGTTLIDLTGDTITASDLLTGVTAHDKSGASITGSCPYDSDTSDDTAAVGELLAGKTAHARGAQLTGTMTNNGGVTGTISIKTGQYTVPQGYHDGSGKVGISSAEQAKIIAGNIKAGVQILGVTGSTPSWSQQNIQPDTGYDYLSGVTVAAIPIAYSDNAAGGQTVTIG